MFKWISKYFNTQKIDEKTLEELEEALIMGDVGVSATADIISKFRKDYFDKDANVKELLSNYIQDILAPNVGTIEITHRPHVIMMMGVNGSGKTTTIGKLAHILKKQGKKVSLVAADTFRAAAVAQLHEWGERNGVHVFYGGPNCDPAALCFDAFREAKERGDDVLIIDTAGRLENKTNLMEELKKMVMVLKKIDTDAPHTKILCLDGTTGQNAIGQIKTFNQFVNLSGLIVNKLDGSSKAGIVISICQEFGLPIFYMGLGEKIDDMKVFDPKFFVEKLLDV